MSQTSFRKAESGDFAFDAENEALAERIIARYPQERHRSAVIPLLDIAQRQNGGWLSKQAIEFVAQAHAELSAIYRLDDHDPALHLAMLDKQRTLELGRAAGVGTPRWWQVDTAADLDSLPADIPYPCLIKPLHSHRFQQLFRKKYWLVEGAQQLREYGQRTLDAELGFMICEQIPGPDTAVHVFPRTRWP